MSIFDGQLNICVSAASGTEAVVKRELEDMGYNPTGADRGRISFVGSVRDLMRVSVNIRTANRVYVVLGDFEAETFDQLFDGVANLHWRDIVVKDARILVACKSTKSTLSSEPACQSVGKKAIVYALTGERDKVLDESGAEYRVELSIYLDHVTVYLDVIGFGLHKRGYRDLVGLAPIRETLAASIISMSVWNSSRAMVDPFCGSGTIPIECAMIATHTPPNLCTDFGYLHYPNIPSVIEDVRDEAREGIIDVSGLHIAGYDIDKSSISMAMRHAKRAGVDKYIHFQQRDMRELSSPYHHGVIITNPPYGERLLKDRELRVLYRDFGKVFANLNDWSLYLITAYPYFEDSFGKRADKTRKMYNSQIECCLYRYLGTPPDKRV